MPYLFLANIDPELQLQVLRQMRGRPRLVALDTMNFWIQGKRDALLRVLREVDLVTINDGEARQLAEEPNLIKAARRIAALGPAHGGGQARRVRRAAARRRRVLRGARPIRWRPYSIRPARGTPSPAASWAISHSVIASTRATMRRAMVYGSVMASFTVEDFSLNRLGRLDAREIDRRYAEFEDLIRLDRA